jgi:hypothetical protein
MFRAQSKRLQATAPVESPPDLSLLTPVRPMLPMRSAAAAPCSLAALLLRRLSSHSSSSVYSVSRHVSSGLSSQPSASYLTASPPCPLSISRRTRGFAAWASAPGPAGPAESPATKALEAKVPALPRGFSLPLLKFCCKFQRWLDERAHAVVRHCDRALLLLFLGRSRSSWRPTRSRSSTPPGTAATSGEYTLLRLKYYLFPLGAERDERATRRVDFASSEGHGQCRMHSV